MILTVIRDKESDLALANLAAGALCGAGLTQPFPGGLPARPSVADNGSLQVMCAVPNAQRVRAGFLRAGFDTIEKMADPEISPKANLVTLAVGPEDPQFLQMIDPAADALCGAGLMVPFDDGKSFSGDPFSDRTVRVQCDQSDAAAVQKGFAAVWKMMQP